MSAETKASMASINPIPNMRKKLLATILLSSLLAPTVNAQTIDGVHYTGTTLSDPNRHDGALTPVVGVHNIQTMRSNAEHPLADYCDWTYNHQPMMAYWQGRFYQHYLSDPRDEQVPPSRTLLLTSDDGYTWSNPVLLFPEYPVPEGFKKEGVEGEAHNIKAVMHQRQGFYVSKDNHLYALASYGICLNKKDHNNDGNGIGRVIREIKKDGSLGKIYFLYYNHDFNEKNTDFPNYRKGDKYLKKACEEILANPRMRMGWVEEADRDDPLIPLNKPYKAYCDYTLPDGRLVALWKHALTSISTDGGKTWRIPVERAPGFVNSNAKIWGQRLADGTYATVYNPSEFRWPLALSLSADGLNYTTLNLVCGEVPPMRYGGNYKSFGPQYVRGIMEGNGIPKDSNLWVSYSMNKEDMWIARIPVPVQTTTHAHANDDFSKFNHLSDLTLWNIYMPKMAPISLDGQWLTLSDSDPFDYARVDRKIPATSELTVSFDIQAAQNSNGLLQIEFLDDHGVACSRLELTSEGVMRAKGGARYGNLLKYEPGKTYHVEANLSVKTRTLTVSIDGKKVGQRMFYAPVKAIERIMFRTGSERRFPTVDTPADWDGKLDNAGATDTLAIYRIANFQTRSSDDNMGAAFLEYDDFKHYVDYFNNMEPEGIVQAIPNSEAWVWMKENVPLFECPQQNFEQTWWFRWWTLRKHLRKTDEGKYAMTEFLVKRSYADKYNLIASGVGHHIRESRWLRNPLYLDEVIETWFFGNGGQPMKKLHNYSSWIASSLWERYLVDNRRDWIVKLLPSLKDEYEYWNTTHRWVGMPESMKIIAGNSSITTVVNNVATSSQTALPSVSSLSSSQYTLFWQADVQDAMEETISGGRKKQYARPSINSYMYGNARAIANIAALAGDEAVRNLFDQRADTICALVANYLWNDGHQFFETLRKDSTSNVREAIGFMPWYCNMPFTHPRYAAAWAQAADPEGFSAPYGQTTAERRHPAFRTHGVGKCEWDGAVWPFATSQTLTGMANYLNAFTASCNIVAKPATRSTGMGTTLSINDSVYFAELEKYVQSQSMRGKPYIGEYLDETTGYWLKGDQERSRYYNHSTFCDLIINGLVGLRPRQDNMIEVNPLLPKGKWSWFCLDRVRYHGHDLTILWDENGSRYHAGKGLRVFVDGELKGQCETLGKILCEM